MSNVVSIGAPRRPSLAQRQAILVENFACHRRASDDVYWLKENAELLSILATRDADLTPQALQTFSKFYDDIEEKLRFFPQYYRFLLSICLDLEDLGMPGHKGAALCKWAADAQLPACELSDLQRAEAERLLARRDAVQPSKALEERLRAFICHSSTFALPNKKAAYELTHIVFYLSNYGTQDPCLSKAAIVSLEFAALMAYLDQDIDLLSEVCVALRFSGQQPSEIWEDWLAAEIHRFSLLPCADFGGGDSYHEYLVGSWWADIAGLPSFTGTPCRGGIEIRRTQARRGPLREMSQLMFNLGAARSADWRQMRAVLEAELGSDQQHILEGAAQSSAQFQAFFERFSRAKNL